jgi:glycosyltransferase involved in cell wall biosynthesis/Tfp pilus assembly protein PilF
MKIAFADPIACDYTIETPYQQPLGGSQSALCYLAEELASQGHEVFLLNNSKTPRISRGVVCLPLPLTNLDPAKLQELDALVVLNLAGYGAKLRSHLSEQTQLILWTGHTHHNRDMQALHNPAELAMYDGFAFVSEWQRDRFCEEFAIAPEKTAILRNAIAPAFTGLFPPHNDILSHSLSHILSQKKWPPILAYTSTPFRGLDLLLEIFPRIRQAVPGTRLKVFSSMKVYHVSDAADNENYGELYRQCQETEGVEYIGAIPQKDLAKELQKVTVLAYPNTYLETSCIAVMEAMASGCYIVTSDLGALPETTAGFARLIPITPDRESYKNQFTNAVISALQQLDESHLRAMVNYINQGFTWSVRSLEWIAWLEGLRQQGIGNREQESRGAEVQRCRGEKSVLTPLPQPSRSPFPVSQLNIIDKNFNSKINMKIAFLDFSDWEYQADSPYQIPLGGSQSALCYLAAALAKLGHEVFLLNGISKETKALGVTCLPWQQVLAPNSAYKSVLNSWDVVIVLSHAGAGIKLRKLLAKHTRLVLWTQQVTSLGVMQGLQDKDEQTVYDGMAFVSSWQRDRFLAEFAISPEKTTILRNAIAPAFVQQFAKGDHILQHKLEPPILAYTSTPFRGLDLLLDIFPKIRQAYPGTRLKVFSSKKVYQLPQSVDESEYGALYNQCRQMEGVEYLGSISQPELAQELRSVSVLAYANTFEETSCIAVMEAMASGCHVVTSDLAALPETTAGYGSLVSVADVQGFSAIRDWRFSQRQDWKAYGERFVAATLAVLRSYQSQEAHLRQMVDYVNQACTWDVRAQEWVTWLQSLVVTDGATDRVATDGITDGATDGITDGATDGVKLCQQGEQLFREGKLSEALAICQQLIRMQPNFAPGYKLLGNILQGKGKIEAAIRAYESAIALNPDFAEALANLGTMYYQNGQLKAAIACYEKAIKLQPKLAGLYWNLAKFFEDQGQGQAAIAYRQKAVELQPSLRHD